MGVCGKTEGLVGAAILQPDNRNHDTTLDNSDRNTRELDVIQTGGRISSVESLVEGQRNACWC